MAFFGFGKKSKTLPVEDPVLIELRIPRVNEPAITPDRLRKELFDAAAAGDEEKLTCLCQAHEKSIFDQGMIWSNLPPEIQSNEKLKQWYGNGLRAIATYCAKRLGKPELMEQLRHIDALPAGDKADEPGKTPR
jgi:hypothetical protein